MGYRVVSTAAGPVIVQDDLDTGLPQSSEVAPFDAAPAPGTGATLDADAPVPDVAAPPAAASDQPATLPGVVDPFAGQPPAPDTAPAPAKVDVPVGDVVNAGGAALGGVGGAAVDVAQSVLTPNGIVGDEPPPPAAEPVPETPEEAQARRDAKRAYLEHQFSVLDDEALSGTATPERRLNIVAEQGAIADLLKATAEEDALVAGDSVKAEQERVKAEAAQQIARQEAEAAARARALEVARQKAEHHIAQIEEQANKPVDRTLGLGIGKSILLALSLVAGGLGSALRGQGDKNPALDIFMQNVDKHVADQWARKKELWGQIDRIAKGMGEMDDKAAVRQKLLESYKTSVLMKASKEMERIAQELPVAKRAAALQLAADTRMKAVERRRTDADNLVKWSIERDKMAEAERNNRAQNRASLISAGAAATNARTNARQQKFEEDKYNSEEAVLDRQIERQKKLAEIEEKRRTATTDAEKKRLDTEKAALDLEQAQEDRLVSSLRPTVLIDPATGEVQKNDDGTVAMTVGNFKQPDGKTDVKLRGKDPNRTRAVLGAVEAYANAVDELVAAIDRDGWSPGIVKTDYYKRAQSLYRALYLEGKDVYNLGALQAPDVKVLDGLFGGSPTALIGDPIVSLRTSRKTLMDKAYTTFKQGSDYRGTLEDFMIPERNRFGVLEAAKNTPAEGLLRQSKERAGGVGVRPTAFWEEENAGLAAGDLTPISKYPSEKAENAIMALAEQAAGAGANAEAAKVQLRYLLETEKDGPVRRFVAREVQRTGADLGVPGFTRTAYDQYELLRRAPGNTTGRIPFVPPVGTQRGLLRGAMASFTGKGD